MVTASFLVKSLMLDWREYDDGGGKTGLILMQVSARSISWRCSSTETSHQIMEGESDIRQSSLRQELTWSCPQMAMDSQCELRVWNSVQAWRLNGCCPI